MIHPSHEGIYWSSMQQQDQQNAEEGNLLYTWISIHVCSFSPLYISIFQTSAWKSCNNNWPIDFIFFSWSEISFIVIWEKKRKLKREKIIKKCRNVRLRKSHYKPSWWLWENHIEEEEILAHSYPLGSSYKSFTVFFSFVSPFSRKNFFLSIITIMLAANIIIV